MPKSLAQRPCRFKSVTAAAALALGLAVLQAGCANTAGSNSSSSSPGEIMTSSDMTDARKRAIIRLQLATGYLERGQLEVALDEVKRAIVADPAYWYAFNLRGLIYAQLGDKALAEDSFRRALALNNRDGNAQHNLAYVLCEQKKYSQAQQFFEMAMANPMYLDKDKTRIAQAVCEIQSGQVAAGEARLLSAYEEGTRSPLIANALAQVYYDRQDYRRAAMYASQANVRNSGSPASLWLAIKIEHKLGNQSGVMRYARILRENYPNSREMQLYERGAWNN